MDLVASRCHYSETRGDRRESERCSTEHRSSLAMLGEDAVERVLQLDQIRLVALVEAPRDVSKLPRHASDGENPCSMAGGQTCVCTEYSVCTLYMIVLCRFLILAKFGHDGLGEPSEGRVPRWAFSQRDDLTNAWRMPCSNSHLLSRQGGENLEKEKNCHDPLEPLLHFCTRRSSARSSAYVAGENSFSPRLVAVVS